MRRTAIACALASNVAISFLPARILDSRYFGAALVVGDRRRHSAERGQGDALRSMHLDFLHRDLLSDGCLGIGTEDLIQGNKPLIGILHICAHGLRHRTPFAHEADHIPDG